MNLARRDDTTSPYWLLALLLLLIPVTLLLLAWVSNLALQVRPTVLETDLRPHRQADYSFQADDMIAVFAPLDQEIIADIEADDKNLGVTPLPINDILFEKNDEVESTVVPVTVSPTPSPTLMPTATLFRP